MQTESTLATPALSRLALTGLVVLMLVSVAFVISPMPAHDATGLHALPPGTVLACFKVAALAYLAARVWKHNVYSLQWSSMFILLFLAEGTVRATSDPQPLAALGVVEALAATLYFVAVLAILRPLKKRSRATSPPR